MKLTPINIKIEEYPAEFVEFLKMQKCLTAAVQNKRR